MSEKNDMSDRLKPNGVDLDWDNRVLCSDGNCIGIIGPDGRCKECGQPYEGKLPWEVSADATAPVEREVASETEEPTPEVTETESEADTRKDPTDDNDWENRKLCSDGNCIGVIGPDGNCKECGKPYAG